MEISASPQYTPFSLSVVPDREDVAVVPVGELDMDTVDAVQEAVAELTSAGFDRIVVDLHEVEFIDSTGLRMLIGLREDSIQNGHDLTLVPATPPAARIFDLTRTRGLFDWRQRFGR